MTDLSFASRRLLPAVEWMAENAYIPPGTHRLLAAGGLSAGLWGGRHFMDVVVGKNSDGTDMTREQSPAMLRPLHGILHYNRYSDNAADRWKGVADRLVPGMLGALGAYYGSRFFFHGTAPKLFGGKAMHGLTNAAEKALATGKISSQNAEHLASLAQSEYMGRGGAVSYIFGSTVGTDKMGGLFPTNQNLWADRFALGAGIKSNIPFLGWFNRRVLSSYGSSSLAMPRAMRSAAKWMEGNLHAQGNPALWADVSNPAHMKKLRAMAQDALQNYPQATEAELNRVAHGFADMAHNAWGEMQRLGDPKLWTAAQKNDFYANHIAGTGHTPGLIHASFDHWMHGMGIPLGKFEVANHGWLTNLARRFGSPELEGKARQAYSDYLKDTFGIHFEGPIVPHLNRKEKLIIDGSLIAGTVATVGAGTAIATHINKRVDKLADGSLVETTEPDKFSPTAKSREQGNVLDWVNGKPLDVAQWVSRLTIIAPGMHRLMSAAYLSAGLYGGMQIANALTGHKLTALRGGSLAQSELSRESFKGIWRPLRSIHGLLEYTPGSAKLADRWRQAAHFLIPIPIGVIGNNFGSHSFFRDRIKKLEKPETLEDYADRISMEQSGVFANLTAVTSIFNTGSGLHLLPFFNYSSNMQSRFTLGNGLQVATPGMGKWWSGNAGMTPWGVKRTLAYAGNYLGQNEAARPTELPSLLHSALAKLYPDMSEDQLLIHKRSLLKALYEVRDTYLVDGKIPEAKKPELTKAMTALVTGHGFEALLQQSGLNPAEANLANNGVSGTIANAMGKAKIVQKLETEYQQKFTERLAKEPTKSPRDYLRQLADHSGEAGVSANDNHMTANTNAEKPTSFAEKIRTGQALVSATAELG
ncbi:MAG: hypothetical protein ACKVOE_09335 [Rickettsiales bacterium]